MWILHVITILCSVISTLNELAQEVIGIRQYCSVADLKSIIDTFHVACHEHQNIRSEMRKCSIAPIENINLNSGHAQSKRISHIMMIHYSIIVYLSVAKPYINNVYLYVILCVVTFNLR